MVLSLFKCRKFVIWASVSLCVTHYHADINECMDDMLNTCDARATCNDTDGSFDCACNAGYYGDGFNCTGGVASLTIPLNWYDSTICGVLIDRY